MAVHCLFHVRATELVTQIQPIRIQGKHREDVAMDNLIVPGRAGAVVAGVGARQFRASGEEIRVIIDAVLTQ